MRVETVTWVSPGLAYGLDEPNTGPFCLMSTQPWAHASGVGMSDQTKVVAIARIPLFRHHIGADSTNLRALGKIVGK